MQKRALCAALCLTVFMSLGSHAAAAESGVGTMVDGAILETEVITQVYNQTTYVSYWPVVQAIYPDATATWEDDHAAVRAEGLSINIKPGANYIEANGRYLYVPYGVQTENQVVLVPATVLARALGATAWWDNANNNLMFQSGAGPIQSGDSFYDADTVYWLSHIINAEAGNQTLTGKIAVGNVVMNRVESPRFPNNVHDVIYQANQFTPVSNGSINKEPNAESVIAAKLCQDGANTAGASLYFVNPRMSPNSWASRNRTYVATIGAHAFFA
ncbi:hypothetical protein CE91St41_16560 [Oscillospiraceae bacterium]|nr:hypothetical protein CE91St40_20980 [Oscillospiraceae bacterium]BDF74767.1 hypothetical protein CE91St41_16560 [Oscillospiraceae bacterium]